MNEQRRQGWESRYRNTAATGLPAPAGVLADHAQLLPESGIALDVACGRGGNALLLAAHGLEAHAWDFAASAIETLQETAHAQGQAIHGLVRDVVAQPPGPDSFDVITVSRFLERSLAPALMQALRPGGLLFYQTFTRDKLDDTGPGNPDFLLQPNELLRLFDGLQVCFYREDGRFGDLDYGLRNEAQFIGARIGR